MITTLFALMLVSGAASQDNATKEPRRWPACLIVAARKYAASKEPAETVAEAAMAACATYEQETRTELLGLQMEVYKHVPGGISQMLASAEAATDRRMGDLRRQMRGSVIGIVMEERAKGAGQ